MWKKHKFLKLNKKKSRKCYNPLDQANFLKWNNNMPGVLIVLILKLSTNPCIKGPHQEFEKLIVTQLQKIRNKLKNYWNKTFLTAFALRLLFFSHDLLCITHWVFWLLQSYEIENKEETVPVSLFYSYR